MNILLVNLGRHVALYDQLINSDLEINNLYLAENDLHAPSSVVNMANSNIKIPKALEAGFIDKLLNICSEKKIDYLFSFIDYGLLKLAQNRQRFAKVGTRVVVSSPDTILTCEDKYQFYQKLRDNGINGVPTFIDKSILEQYNFPIFAKPRCGNASQGIAILHNSRDLDYFLGIAEAYVFQPLMKDREYGIDLLVKQGQIYDLFMKEKIALRAGTTDKAVSAWENGIYDLIKKVIQVFDFEGPVDLDVFSWKGAFFINEINPRFGGGYATAIKCGKNFFCRYIRNNRNDKPNDYKPNIKTVRYENTILV